MPGTGGRTPRVLITGASSGIGCAASRELVSRGWTVFGGVRREADARRLRAELGESFQPLMLDVTDPAAVREAAGAVEEALAGAYLDALVNNAGTTCLGPLACLSTEALRGQFEVNLFGLFEVTRRFLPLLGAARGGAQPALCGAQPALCGAQPALCGAQPASCGSPPASCGAPGRIVNLSSASGRLAFPFFGFYAASKHALEGLSDALRRELQLYGIHVILIEPSIVRTPLVEKSVAQAQAFRDTAYWPAIQSALKATGLDRPDGVLPVQRVVRVLLRALTSPRPRARYAIPRNRLLGWWLPLALPARVLDRFVGRSLGLLPGKGA